MARVNRTKWPNLVVAVAPVAVVAVAAASAVEVVSRELCILP
jgi:hypothetical protein